MNLIIQVPLQLSKLVKSTSESRAPTTKLSTPQDFQSFRRCRLQRTAHASLNCIKYLMSNNWVIIQLEARRFLVR